MARSVREIRREAEKRGIRIPYQIVSKKGILNYLRAQLAIAKLQVRGLEEKLKKAKEREKAINELLELLKRNEH